MTVRGGLAPSHSFLSPGRRPRDLHQLLCRAQPPGPLLQDGRRVRCLLGQRQEVRQGCRGGTPESKRYPSYPKPLVVFFFPSPLSWFCHLDDDNYLNPWALLKLLSSYSATWDVYLGKPSLNRPIRASEMLPNNQTVQPMVVVWGPVGCF